MLRLAPRLLVGLLVLALSGGTAGGLIVTEPWAGPERAGYIVQANDPAMLILAMDLQPTHTYSEAITGFAADLRSDEAAALARQPGVHVEPDLEFEALELPTGVDRVDAERYWPTGRGAGTTVAVLDTGIAVHPDFEVVADLSRDFTGSGTWRDRYGHGTHVAGIIGGQTLGVAPAAGLVSVKVLSDNGTGNLSWILAGLEHVIANRDRIDIINMSLGAGILDLSRCPTTTMAFHQAICNTTAAGIVVVVAAGNSNADARNYIPATYPEVLTVSALADSDGKPGGRGPTTERGADDSLASFSNWGADIDLAAPGVDIVSAALGGGTVAKSGTSMASPHVAGLAALWIEAHGKPTDGAGVQAVHAGLKALAATQGGPCGLVGDRDAYAEPVAMAVPCEGNVPTPVPPTPTPTPAPIDPPTNLTARTECYGGEMNVILSWQDNTINEVLFGIYLDDAWRGSVAPDMTRFLWPAKPSLYPGTHTAKVGALVRTDGNLEYAWSEAMTFVPQCPDDPVPTPTPPMPAPDCGLYQLRIAVLEGAIKAALAGDGAALIALGRLLGG